jgi:hypothetical protein
MLNLVQDLKFALRMLVKNPGFTLVAVLTLALGIGANSAIFSVVDAVMLQPLPYKDPGQLLFLSGLLRQTGTPGASLSFTKFTQIQEQSHTLEGSAAFYGTTLSLVTEREPEAVSGNRVSRSFFRVLGIFFPRRKPAALRTRPSSPMDSGTATSRRTRARWVARSTLMDAK